ncbi:MAG TPA: ATP-binding protein [Candidatus Limnocylindrales bacterium]
MGSSKGFLDQIALARTTEDLSELLGYLRRRLARDLGEPELTYRQIALRTGWSRASIGEYFCGQTLPPTPRFSTLLDILGAGPEEKTQLVAIRDRVAGAHSRRRRAATAPPQGRDSLAGNGSPWPFVGRERELELVRNVLERAGAAVVLLVGDAGVGKTRLARQVARQHTTHAAWVLANRSIASIPFGAVAHLLSRPGAPEVAPVQMMQAILRRFDDEHEDVRSASMLVVDDAHLLDGASAGVVAQLVEARSVPVVLTARNSEPMPDALTRFAKEGTALIVRVEPLPPEAIAQLVEHHQGGQRLGALARRRLIASAAGNPLALRELLLGAMPGGLTDLVISRLESLPADVRDVVELVTWGEPLPMAVLERIASDPAVVTAEATGLVAVRRDGDRTQARLGHPLYGDVLRRRLALSRSRGAHRRLAQALMALPMRRRDDTLRAAVWQVEGGSISRPEVVREGARQAIGRADLALAERLARVARLADPGAAADRLLAEILEYRGRSAEAAAVMPSTPPADARERTYWAVTRADALYWGADDPQAAYRVLDGFADDPVVVAARSWIQFFDGRCDSAVATAAKVLALTDAPPQAVVWASAAGAAAHGFLGDPVRARAIHERGAAVALAHSGQLPWAGFEVDVGACLAHLACGEFKRADSIAQTGYQAALDSGVPMMVAGWALHGGLAAAARGHLPRAERHLQDALSGFQVNDTFRLTRCCLGALAWVAALKGDGAAAQGYLERVDSLAMAANRIFEPWLGIWRAWAAAARGTTGQATGHARNAVRLARRAGFVAVEARALCELVRLGGRVDLAALGDRVKVYPHWIGATLRGLSDRDPFRLAAVVDELAEVGDDLLAADAARLAAREFRRLGRPGDAEKVASKARALQDLCTDVRTP